MYAQLVFSCISSDLIKIVGVNGPNKKEHNHPSNIQELF